MKKGRLSSQILGGRLPGEILGLTWADGSRLVNPIHVWLYYIHTCMGGLTSEGVQYAGSLRIAYPFKPVFKFGYVGYYIEKCRLLQNVGLGQFEGWGWTVRGWHRFTQAKPKIQKLGCGVIIVSTACKPHAMKSMGAPVVQIDDLDAGGPLCPR